MPQRMCCMLYRALDFVGHTRYAERETGWCALRAARCEPKLLVVWFAAAAAGLRQPQAFASNVRRQSYTGAAFFAAIGAADKP